MGNASNSMKLKKKMQNNLKFRYDFRLHGTECNTAEIIDESEN